MDFIPYILLIPIAFVLGTTDLATSCQDNNCTSADTDANSSDESDLALLGVDPDIRELHLDHCNNLTILELTPNLRTLEIFNCSWIRLEITKLRAVGNLRSLYFRNSSLLRLGKEMFVQLPHLVILGLGGNKIAIVSPDALKGLTQLWMLSLNDNSLVYFEDKVFHPLAELRHLDLSNNGIFNLPDAIFDKNPKLQVLLLNGNRLLSINPYTLAILKNLILLVLSHNAINEMQFLSSETIIIDSSRVYRMHVLGNVSKFQARNNFLEYLEFEQQSSVTELDLHGNKLTTEDMSIILKAMWRLQRLDLSANLAKELPTFDKVLEVYLLPSLSFVNISSNLLEHLNGDSPLLSPSLSHLDLSYNRICEMDPNIFSLVYNLQSLHIEGNRLDHFRYEIFHNQQQGLKEVALYDNEISYESYKQITQYFREAGVHVLDQKGLTSVKKESSMEKCVRAEKDNDNLKIHSHSKEELDLWESTESVHRQFNTFRKLSLWNILIFLSLLGALALNAILVLQLRRYRGRFEDNSNLL
ncbi:toll-like receptor Tollo [Drosophila kikkawai]|uniref:Toll-like receptor Tollo n=1 Tax=Drosophila kikkawai TaxID=30033 RepID=A0A6P4HP69_DROKI|nr:leucine-rich repeat-containing G-protein coupled receptor 5-like [Drosophila kikkawai]